MSLAKGVKIRQMATTHRSILGVLAEIYQTYPHFSFLLCEDTMVLYDDDAEEIGTIQKPLDAPAKVEFKREFLRR